jgi:hypothetical protein
MIPRFFQDLLAVLAMVAPTAATFVLIEVLGRLKEK